MKSLRVIFMGTPEFAVPSLGSLLMNGYDVAGVVTSPDKPAGRGRSVSRSAVKLFAESSYLPLLQPVNLKDPAFIEQLYRLKADIFVVVAFRMLPEVVWRIPSMGTFNLHASLLPQYRGAAPINHVIINGESKTGVTTFLINENIDCGNILLRDEIPVSPFENAGELHDKLMRYGAKLVIRTIEGIADGNLKPKPQEFFMTPGEVLKPAPKIFPENCIIDWNNTPDNIYNFIRGLAPYPGARSSFTSYSSSLSYKIFESRAESATHNFKPGEVFSDGKKIIKIACKEGFIRVISLQAESRKRMNCEEFLSGFGITDFSLPLSQAV